MLPHQGEPTDDSRFSFSFGNATDITEDDLVRVQKLMGSHDYSDNNGLGKDDYGGRYRLFDYPLPVMKSQTMVLYRQEMMARAESMPEGTYELSLRDIVELPKAAESSPAKDKGKAEQPPKKKKDWIRVKKLKEHIIRTKHAESGVFLLKMFFPQNLYGKNKSAVVGSKVSPKPPVLRDSSRSAAETSGYEDMSRSSSKSNSGRRKVSGCYSFLSLKRGHQ